MEPEATLIPVNACENPATQWSGGLHEPTLLVNGRRSWHVVVVTGQCSLDAPRSGCGQGYSTAGLVLAYGAA